MAKTGNPDVDKFDRWAASYDRSMLQKWIEPVQRSMLEMVAQRLPEGQPRCVIDVGCGTGRLLRAAALRWPQARLFGVDPAEGMVDEARRLNPRAEVRVSPAESLPFPDDSADLVLSSLSFHHWADQRRGIQEVARVLRPGGWFCLGDHTFVFGRWFGGKALSPGQLQALMASAGLEVRQRRRKRFILITLAQKRA